ncbi:MAG TPA: hypothetical protein VMH87_17350 [Pseudomonadales bacterium]|nr:hypothetical protein [Pseudomonadales bacterium]
MAAACLGNAEPSTNLLSRLEPVPPFPELQKAAKTMHIPLDGMKPLTNAPVLVPGNSITALITLHQKGNRLTQWLVYFEVVASTNSTKPEKPLVLYNSMGDKFEFTRSPAAFSIRSIGPYVDSDSFWGNPVAKDKRANAAIDGAFLSLGLDKGAAAIYRVRQDKQDGATNFDFGVEPKPPPAAKIAHNRKLATELKITPEEERALAAWFPAMNSYFTSVGNTPNLQGILMKVMSFPSLWSIVKHGGVNAEIGFGLSKVHPVTLPAQWNIPGGAAVYSLPMSIDLNGQPAINSTLLITNPHPPLLGCGGIIGFIAENPNDSQNYMTLRVISAQ